MTLRLNYLKLQSMITKVCSHCKKEKPVNDFPYKKSTKDGFDWWCRSCWSVFRGVDVARRYRPNGHPRNAIDCIATDMCDNTRKRQKHVARDITPKFILDLLKDFCEKNYHVIERRHPFSPSIDRIDSTKGYVKENVRIVWLIENYCKNSFTDDVVIEFCKRKLGLV